MANFVKGQPRAPNAGRKKGTPNKVTTSLRQQVATLAFDLGAAAIDLFNNSEDESIKVKMLELIAKYTQVVPTSEPEDLEKEASPEDSLSTEELEELAQLAGQGNG